MEKIFISPKTNIAFLISVSGDFEKISVSVEGCNVGSISLYRLEDDYSGRFCYFICGLDLEKCRRQGVGEAALLFHRHINGGVPIGAANSWELFREDGAHLTGDGLPFIARMREKGIVSPES
jgi:hypothetical protein